MSAKSNYFIVFILSTSVIAVVAGVYGIQQWHSQIEHNLENQQEAEAKAVSTEKIATASYKSKYKSIPLDRFGAVLRGSDPATLAINAFDADGSKEISRKVEVVYPEPNQAMVTITQTNSESSQQNPVKYKVKLTSFGRSLFVNSPPLWQIVWAGSSEQCLGNRHNTIASAACP